MAALGYRLRSLLRARWRTTVAVALVVGIAGGLALTLVAGALRTLSAPDRYVDTLPTDFDAELQQQEGLPRTADVAGLPAVREVRMATFVFAGVLAPRADEPVDLAVFAGRLGPIGARLSAGREPARPNEFALTKSVFDASGARLGDTYRLVTFTRAQAEAGGFDAGEPEGPTFDAKVVGVLDDSAAQLSDGTTVALFPPSLLRAGDIGFALTVGSVGLAPGATLADLRSQLAALPDGSVFSVKPATPVADEVRTAVNAQGQGVAVLAIIAAVATVVVLGQLLSRQYRRTDPESTVLASLGYTRIQLLAEPVAEAAVAVVLGAVLAGAASFLASGFFPRGFVSRIEPEPGLLLEPVVHLVGPVLLAVTLLLWMLGSLALSDAGSVPARPSGLVDRLTRAIPNAAASLGLHFALGRTPGRTRATRIPFVGLMVIAAFLFGALTFGRNLGLVLDEPERYGENFDLGVGQGGAITPAEMQPLLADASIRREIAGLTLYGVRQLNAGRVPLHVVGMQQIRGHLAPDVLQGRLPAAPDEIALGRIAARHLAVDVGDSVTLTTEAGPRRLRVTGLVLPPPVSSAEPLGDTGVVTAAGYHAVAPGEAFDTAAIDLVPGAPDSVTRRIARAAGGDEAAGQFDPPGAVLNLQRVRNIPLLVAAVVGGFAAMSLCHQLLVAVRRRRRDLAVLRALGASRRSVTGVVHVQATIVTATVLLVAVPLGIAAGFGVYRPFVDRLGTRTDLEGPGWWAFLAVVALLVLANLVAGVPARRARRTSPSRTLAGS